MRHQLIRGQSDSSILLASLGAELPEIYLPADAAAYDALMGLAAPKWAKQFEHLLILCYAATIMVSVSRFFPSRASLDTREFENRNWASGLRAGALASSCFWPPQGVRGAEFYPKTPPSGTAQLLPLRSGSSAPRKRGQAGRSYRAVAGPMRRGSLARRAGEQRAARRRKMKYT